MHFGLDNFCVYNLLTLICRCLTAKFVEEKSVWILIILKIESIPKFHGFLFP